MSRATRFFPVAMVFCVFAISLSSCIFETRQDCPEPIDVVHNVLPDTVSLVIQGPDYTQNVIDPPVFDHPDRVGLGYGVGIRDRSIATGSVVNGIMRIRPEGIGVTGAGLNASIGSGDCEMIASVEFTITVVDSSN